MAYKTSGQKPQKPQKPWYDRILSIVLNTLTFIASAALCALILIVTIDVIGRYFINLPLVGSNELTEITLAVIVFTSLPIVSYHNKHIAVDLLDGYMPLWVQRGIAILSYGLIAFGVYTISVYSEKIIQRAFRRDIVTQQLEIPVGYITMYAQLMGYVTCALMIVLIVKSLYVGKEK